MGSPSDQSHFHSFETSLAYIYIYCSGWHEMGPDLWRNWTCLKRVGLLDRDSSTMLTWLTAAWAQESTNNKQHLDTSGSAHPARGMRTVPLLYLWIVYYCTWSDAEWKNHWTLLRWWSTVLKMTENSAVHPTHTSATQPGSLNEDVCKIHDPSNGQLSSTVDFRFIYDVM